MTQEHEYSCAELAEEWGVPPETIYTIFENYPGVSKDLRIPLAVAIRFWKENTKKPSRGKRHRL